MGLAEEVAVKNFQPSLYNLPVDRVGPAYGADAPPWQSAKLNLHLQSWFVARSALKPVAFEERQHKHQPHNRERFQLLFVGAYGLQEQNYLGRGRFFSVVIS